MNKMFVFLTFSFFLFISPNFFATRALSEHELAKLIKSVADQFNCKCVILLSSSLEGLSHEIHLQKPLSEPPQLYIGIWDIKTFIQYLYSDGVSKFKTLVVMKDNNLNLKNLSLISRKVSISAFDWLILSTASTEIETRFKDIIIPIHCRFLVSTQRENGFVGLHELYRVSRTSDLIKKKYANWSLEGGFDSLKADIFNTRTDFRGHRFNFAVHNLSNGINPCQTFHIDNGKQMIQCAHFDVWKILGRVLNYTTKYVIIEDCYKNGSTGLSTPMLEMIRTGGADSGEDGYIWSSARLIHNQFLWPLYHSKVILVTKVPSRKFSFSSYVRPFDANMWLALISWLLLSGQIIILTKSMASKYIYKKKIPVMSESVENLFLPFAAICYQSSCATPKKVATRIAFLVIYLIPVLLIPSYSGSIISSLSVPSENVPFSDLDEFLEDGTYQLNAINNTFFQFFLMTDEKFEALRKKKLVSNAMTVSYEQSFQEICSKRVTFIYEWPILTKYSINCNVFKFDLSLKKIFSSMAVPKNFPYLELFNRQIQRLISTGLNMKILEKNTLKLFKHEVNPFPQNYFQIKPFGLEDVLPLFAVLAVGISLSVFLLFFEKHAARKKVAIIISRSENIVNVKTFSKL